MKDQPSVVVVIPAYRPGQELMVLLAHLRSRDHEVILVDDGSGPDYVELFSDLGEHVHVFHHRGNRGKGAALKSGFAMVVAAFNEVDVIVTVDADGQHAPDDVDRVVAQARAHPGSLVLGARALDGAVPVRSRWGNTLTRKVFTAATGTDVRDTQTGLRACTLDLLPDLLAIDGQRYEYEMNVLLEFARRGIEIREVPIRTIYLNQNAASHFRTITDSALIYREILRYSGSSLLSFGVDYGAFAALTGALAGFGVAGIVAANIGARIISGSVNFTLNRKLVFRPTHVGAGGWGSRRGNTQGSPGVNLANGSAEDGAGSGGVRTVSGERAPLGRAIWQYAALATGVLTVNTLALAALTEFTSITPYLAKIIVEVVLFLAAWWIQRTVIFAPVRPSTPVASEPAEPIYQVDEGSAERVAVQS